MAAKPPRVPKNNKKTNKNTQNEGAQNPETETNEQPEVSNRRVSQREAAVAEAKKVTDSKRGQKTLEKRRASSEKDRIRAAGRRRTPTAADQQPARNFSGRTVALLMVLFLAVVVLVPSLRLMFDQQAEINEANAQLQAEREREEELLLQLERWEDDAYVKQQARERFNMVMPGERKYTVVGEEQFDVDPAEEDETEDGQNTEGSTATSTDSAWADDLWGSFIQAAQQ